MNKIFLIGNLTRDPVLSETQSGVAVCRFAIAVKRRFSSEGEPQADFFNVTAWRGLADVVAKHCKKGNKVAVSGSIQIRQYEANDGVKRTSVDVVAEDVEFLTPRPQDGAEEPKSAPKKKPVLEPFEDDGDIPF